jgi:hypothetical protein
MVAFDNGWWEFYNGPIPSEDDALIAQSQYGGDLTPQGDFTLLMLVEELNSNPASSDHGLMGNCIVGLSQEGGYDIRYNGESAGSPGQIKFRICKINGTHNRELTTSTGIMAIGRKVLIACTFDWVADGNSVMKIVTIDGVNGKLTAQRSDAWGPPGDNSVKLYIGSIPQYAMAADAKIYWCAIYDGLLMTEQDVEDIWDDTKHPVDDFTPRLLNHFCQDVGSTYTADEDNGPNEPYVFDVRATPVLNGDCGVEDVSVLGHEFAVSQTTQGILGHDFSVELPGIGAPLGHQFTVPPRTRTIDLIPENDLAKLSEELGVLREEPEQLQVEPVLRGPAEEQPTEQQRIEDAVNNLQEWLVAAAQMQKVLGEKLKNRRITIDPKRNPAVRDAIRRLFGEDSSTITYDMYKQALEWRSKLLEEGRNNTYGTSS